MKYTMHIWHSRLLQVVINISHCMVSVAAMHHSVESNNCSMKKIMLGSTSMSATYSA